MLFKISKWNCLAVSPTGQHSCCLCLFPLHAFQAFLCMNVDSNLIDATRHTQMVPPKPGPKACMEPSFGATLCLTNFWFIDHTQTRPFLFHRGLSAWYTNGTVRKSVWCLPKSWCNTSVPDINASTVAEDHLHRDVIFALVDPLRWTFWTVHVLEKNIQCFYSLFSEFRGYINIETVNFNFANGTVSLV